MRFDGRIIDPKEGSVRFKKRFAFFPTRASNQLIWFESFQIMEAFCVYNQIIRFNGYDSKEDKVVEKERVMAWGEWVQVDCKVIDKDK